MALKYNKNMKQDKHLIIDQGEVGNFLYKILKPYYPVYIRDKKII